MTVETKKSFCRICTACCAIEVDIEDNRIKRVRGDASDPVSGGYSCRKGRAMAYQAHGPRRLTSSLKRMPDGSYAPISTKDALDEIAEKIRFIIDKNGPRSVASFCGTAAYANSVTVPLVQAWHRSLDSPSNYSTMTLDQPAKIVAVGRLGMWGGGVHTFSNSDVAMCIGLNPIVSGLSMFGAPPGYNPYKSIKAAKKRGMKIICIDPRRTELARYADIHLQVRPGEDPALLACILRTILDESLHDEEFCTDHVADLSTLRDAVRDFTPEYTSKRTGVAAGLIIEAARIFGKGPRGCVSSGTGPDMSPRNCLTEHLISTINIVCGRFYRQGDTMPNAGILSAPVPRPAQVIPPQFLPPFFSLGKGPESRFHGLHQVCGEMPGCLLADEILEPGEGQVKALLVASANPAVSMPDQEKMVRALQNLELSVCVEIEMSATARQCDYVIAARHLLEREDVTEFMDMFYEVPYGFYTEQLIDHDSELIEDWQLFTGLAERLGIPIELPGGAIDPGRCPDKFSILKLLKPQTRISLDDIRSKEGGHVFDELHVSVDPPIPGIEAQFHCAPEYIKSELSEIIRENSDKDILTAGGEPCTHLLISRRLRHVNNSYGQSYPELQKEGKTNYAYLNRDDCTSLGISEGDFIDIESQYGMITGIASPTDEVGTGVISMSHCWGGTPDQDLAVRDHGVNTNLLLKTDRDFERITGQARMSAIPVAVKRV